MLSGIVSGIVTLGLSFLLTPYLVKNLGDEAYGYIGLSNSFISIASVFTVALNSMANRFIMLAYEKKDEEKVNRYFSSLFAGGVILSGFFLIGGVIAALNIDKIFKISASILFAVKITFMLSIINFVVITLLSVFTASAFIADRLDLIAKADIQANLFKVVFLISVFSMLKPQIYYVTLGGLLYTAILYIQHIKNTKKLLPKVKISIALAKIDTIKELIVAGSWNSFSSVLIILMNGLDLALANWLLDGRAMGIISISATMTVASNIIVVAVVNSFKPTLTKTYAQGDMHKLHTQIVTSNRLQCAVAFVPIIGLCIFSSKFYQLWMPFKSSEDILLLAAITAVKCLDQAAGLSTDAINANFMLFNRLKEMSIAKMFVGVMNVPLVVILVTLFDNYNLNVVIISCLSSVLMLGYYWGAVPLLAKRATGQKISEYYKIIAQAAFMFIILVIPFAVINSLTVCNSWIEFAVVVSIVGALGYLLMIIVSVKKQERAAIYNKIKRIIRGKQ